jgi:hypothetical protein
MQRKKTFAVPVDVAAEDAMDCKSTAKPSKPGTSADAPVFVIVCAPPVGIKNCNDSGTSTCPASAVVVNVCTMASSSMP